jgi:hypothetical protein
VIVPRRRSGFAVDCAVLCDQMPARTESRECIPRVSGNSVGVSDNSAGTSDDSPCISDNSAAVSDDFAVVSDRSTEISDNSAAVSDGPAGISDNCANISDNSSAISDGPRRLRRSPGASAGSVRPANEEQRTRNNEPRRSRASQDHHVHEARFRNVKNSTPALGPFSLLLLIAASVVLLPARAGADVGETYYYDEQYNRVPVPSFRDELYSPYRVDPVNRRSSLTPEPVWRSMFRSIHERIAIEQRAFGVGGVSARELRYWKSVE